MKTLEKLLLGKRRRLANTKKEKWETANKKNRNARGTQFRWNKKRREKSLFSLFMVH